MFDVWGWEGGTLRVGGLDWGGVGCRAMVLLWVLVAGGWRGREGGASGLGSERGAVWCGLLVFVVSFGSY